MKTKPTNIPKIGVLFLALFAATAAPLHAQINSWLIGAGGKWEGGTNWSFGAPGFGQSIYITNFGTKTVTIDATTSGSFSNTMSINDLTLFGTTNLFTNSLALANAGTATPLQIATTLTVGSGLSPGAITISNSAMQIGSTVLLNRGNITLISGLLNANNGSFIIGNTPNGAGNLTINGGTALFGPVNIANAASDTGFWTINGGTNTCHSSITVGNTGTGTLTVNGGVLSVTNSGAGFLTLAGNVSNSIGSLVITNGEVDARILQVGFFGQGSLSLSGGILTASSNLVFGISNGSSGSALITGGTLAVTNAAHNAIFEIRRGSFTNSGGIFQADNLIFTNGGSMNLLAAGSFAIGSAAGASNTMTISSGSTVNVTGAALGAGNDATTTNGSGTGSITVSNASLSAFNLNLGSSAGGSGALTIQSNGTVNVTSNLTVVGTPLSSTSSIVVAGGNLTVTNGSLFLGTAGSCSLTVASNSTVTAQTIKIGSSTPGASGTMIMNGGTLRVTGKLSVNSTNSFDLPGINVVVDGTGSTLILGEDNDGVSRITSPSATMHWMSMFVGSSPQLKGTYIQSAGQVTIDSNLIVGNCVSNATGSITLSGGALYVTNATHTAILNVRDGTFLLNSGAILIVDNLIVTNSCGHFIKNGGTLMAANILLDPNMDADGDGMSNGWEQAHGLDPLSASGNDGPNADPDGDGQSNLKEFLAGTDPHSAASSFRILSVTISGQDVVVSWTTVGGHSYVVQASNTKPANASFADVSPVINIGGTSEGTTTYRHVGGANHPRGFYRVRLGP